MKSLFVIGCGHSGTTLLASMLGFHPLIYTVLHETCWFLSDKDYSQDYQIECKKAKASGKSILCEKTPRHVHQVDKISCLLPDLQFIGIVREPKDVVASLKRRNGDFDGGLNRWIKDNEAMLRIEKRKDVIISRYEDLVVAPKETLSRICHFIGIEYDSSMLEYWKSETPWFNVVPEENDGVGEKKHVKRRAWQMTQPLLDRRNTWHSLLSHEEASIVSERTQHLARCFGYC